MVKTIKTKAENFQGLTLQRMRRHGKFYDLAQNGPTVNVDSDPIFARDGNCFTSARVTASIDSPALV